MPDLDVRGLCKHYGNITALDDVTFHINDKEYVCIIGPSGCGKSTLIKCIAGIVQPHRGEIRIDDQPVGSVPIEDRNIGYVFQDIALFPHMSVRDNLAYGLAVRNSSLERINTVTNEMLDLINMRERVRAFPSELSGGAQQKVAVGRAIATGSRLFLLDEPLGALDALVRAELRYELRKLASDLGLTIIHVTHNQEEALSIADRVVIMKSGRVVEIGKPSEVYIYPKSVFTENFVGETNLLEGVIAETNDLSCTVEIGTRKVKIPSGGRKRAQRVVVSIRPEFISLERSTSPRASPWSGHIKHANFLGGISRYVVEVEPGLDLVAHVPSMSEEDEFRVEERVDLHLDEGKHMLLFDYPPEGLEKEIALE